MIKKELLLKVLKIIIIYSYLSSLCCFYLIVFMIGFEGELFTVTQFYLILYGVPLSASICFWFYRKKVCRYLFWFIMTLSFPFTLFYLWGELYYSTI